MDLHDVSNNELTNNAIEIPVSMDRIADLASEALASESTEFQEITHQIRQVLSLEEQQSQLVQQINRINKVLEENNPVSEVRATLTNFLISKAEELGQIKTKISQANIDFSKPVNLFIKNALLSINNKPQVILTEFQKNHLLQQAFQIGLTGVVHPDLTVATKIMEGQRSLHHSLVKLDALYSFQHFILSGKKSITEGEMMGLERMRLQRTKMVEYDNLITNNLDKEAIDKVLEDLGEFDKPSSDKVITREDGRKSFSIPAGWPGHFMVIEFIDNGDGTCDFIPHNRENNQSEIYEKIHGKIQYREGNEVYRNASPRIRVPMSAVKNREFISFLIQSKTGQNISRQESYYEHLHEHLINRFGGEIVLSEVEKEVLLLMNQPDTPERNELIKAKLKGHPGYFSLQKTGTCTEDSTIPAEKGLAPPSIHHALKIFTLETLVTQIGENLLSNISKKSALENLEELLKALPESHAAYPVVKQVKETYSNLQIIEKAIVEVEELMVNKDDPEVQQKLRQKEEEIAGLNIAYSTKEVNFLDKLKSMRVSLAENLGDRIKDFQPIRNILLEDAHFSRIILIHLGKKLDALKRKE